MDKVTIKIPRALYDKVKRIIVDSGFSSPTEFIIFVLRDLLGETKGVEGAPKPKQSPELTAEEIASIKKRLKNLGYL